MTAFAIAFSIAAQICLVCSHLVIKHAMNQTHLPQKPWASIIWLMSIGIGVMTVWFLMWLYLLKDWDLSQLFPFEGLTPPLLVFGAWFFLKETISGKAWIGIALIGLGTAIVSQS